MMVEQFLRAVGGLVLRGFAPAMTMMAVGQFKHAPAMLVMNIVRQCGCMKSSTEHREQ